MSQIHFFRLWMAVSILLLVCLPTVPILAEPNELGTIQISVGTLNVRENPGLDSAIVAKVHKGQIYPILSNKNNWVQIELDSNRKGWVASWLVEMKNSPSVNTVYVTPAIEILNIRSGPSTSFQVIDQIRKGESYPKLDAKGDWVKVRLSDQTEGWAANWLLTEKPREALAKDANATPASTITVSVPVLNVRTGPDISNSLAGQVQKGTALNVLERKGDWLKVEGSGLTGWVAAWLVSSQEQTSLSSPAVHDKPFVKILHPGTNIRSGPSTSDRVIQIANEGDRFEVIQAEGDWFQIRLSSGSIGYVAGWIVAAEGVPNVERKGIEQLLKGKKIIVDPGHGGTDTGAIGPHLGSLEKVLNLKVSKLLSSKLEAAGATVLMTRTDDRKVTLQQRVDLSINEQADAFISVHHNTNENYRINGIITYFYSNGEDRSLAGIIQKELVKRTGLADLKARYGNYFVLRENSQLAVLCELGFLTNYQEEVILNTNDFQEQAAESIFQGIIRYFNQKDSPNNTL